MRPPREPLFVAKRSYRQRRLADAARLLPILGIFLFGLPLLWGAAARTASGVLFVFGSWAILILAAAVLSARLGGVRDAAEADPDDIEP